VVMPDAEVDATARNVVASAYGCAGQRCMAASALIAVGDCDAILDAIEVRAREIVLDQHMGSVISPAAKARIEAAIARAESDGARIRVDGRGATVAGKEAGCWVGATLIDQLAPGHPCLTEEIFGPVLSILRVPTLEDAIRVERASPFGNAASIFTRDGATAAAFERAATAGMVGINLGVPVPREPFAFGGWNDSKFGHGDITGLDGARFWTRPKKVTRKWNAPSENWMS